MYEMLRGVGHRPAPDPQDLILDLRFSGPLRCFLAFVRGEIRIRTEIAKISALDDHLLADMAVSRRDIKHAVRGHWSRIEPAVGD